MSSLRGIRTAIEEYEKVFNVEDVIENGWRSILEEYFPADLIQREMRNQMSDYIYGGLPREMNQAADSMFSGAARMVEESQRREATARNGPRTIIHLKKRDGWTQTKREEGHGESYVGRDLMVPFPMTFTNDGSVYSLGFRLVKEANIRNYDTGQLTRELWYVEA